MYDDLTLVLCNAVKSPLEPVSVSDVTGRLCSPFYASVKLQKFLNNHAHYFALKRLSVTLSETNIFCVEVVRCHVAAFHNAVMALAERKGRHAFRISC